MSTETGVKSSKLKVQRKRKVAARQVGSGRKGSFNTEVTEGAKEEGSSREAGSKAAARQVVSEGGEVLSIKCSWLTSDAFEKRTVKRGPQVSLHGIAYASEKLWPFVGKDVFIEKTPRKRNKINVFTENGDYIGECKSFSSFIKIRPQEANK